MSRFIITSKMLNELPVVPEGQAYTDAENPLPNGDQTTPFH